MNRNVFTIFSDDVRHEIGGKISYIGTYSGKMFVPSFPITIPKLCLSLKITTASSKPFKKLKVRIYRDEEVFAEGEMAQTDLERPPAAEDGEEDGVPKKNRLHAIHMGFIFSPFSVEKSCLIRVRVETESEELRGTGLRIALAPPGMIHPPM